jgi:DNA invertase Pin-like site-specific DNA recombinase
VEAGRVDCAVSYRLDRISRELVDTVTLVRQEWAGKCIYRSPTEGFDTSQDSPTGGLIFNILASLAEFERAVIRDRTWAGSLRRMTEGMYISGTVPYGDERAGKGQLAIKRGEAETVARIFDMALRNVTSSASTISRHLNDEGIPGPTGNKCWNSAVERILRSPLYAGTVVYGKRSMPNSLPGGMGSTNCTETPWPRSRTLSQRSANELFAKVNSILAQRKGAKPQSTSRAIADYLLTTIGTCKCGAPLRGVKDRHGHVYYRCQHKQKGLGCPVNAVAFRGAPVEEQLVAELIARFGGTRREEAIRVLRDRHAANSRKTELELPIKEKEQRTAQVVVDLARLRRKARQGELKASTYEDFKTDAAAEMQELEEDLRELQVQHATTGTDTAVLERLEQVINAVDTWDALCLRKCSGHCVIG